jgi:hypothetical protein
MAEATSELRLPRIGVTERDPGWHEGLDMAAYLSDPAVSASGLWKLYTETPAHLLHDLVTRADDQTPAKALGSLTHTKVFEPDEFDSRYVVLGQCEAKVKKTGQRCTSQGSVYRDGQSFCGVQGHDPYGKHVAMDASLELVTQGQRDAAIAADKALKAHPTAAEILGAEGMREVTGIWKDPGTGLMCRIRPDLLISAPAGTPDRYHYSVTNLKTTTIHAGAGPGHFQADFNRRGQYFKAAFYRLGVRELWDIEPQNFLYPVVETTPPYEVIVYRLNEDALDIGENEVLEALNTLATCVESGRWPGYGVAVHDLTLPDWRLRMAHDIDRLELAS